MADMTQQEMNMLLRRQDADNAWRKYQVHYEESKLGPFQIKKFSIPPWDKKRRQTIQREGVRRDPGSGDFTKLIEIVPGAGEDGGPGQITWMSDTRAEILEHTPILNKLFFSRGVKHKRLLVNGLGLGLVVHAALIFASDSVEHIDVVEHNADVIELVGNQLTVDPRVTIHLADAYDMIWDPGTRWDFAWHDIWPSIDDENLPGMDRLLYKYKTRVAWQGCWQRDGCLAMAKVFRQMKDGTLPAARAWELLGGKGWLG